MPWSYFIEAQGKKYRRTREHVQPIHLNLPPPQQSAEIHKQQCFSRPSAPVHIKQAIARPSQPPQSLIPRPDKGKPCLARPSVLTRPPLPCLLSKLPSCILHPPGVNKAITVFPSEEDLHLHLSTLVPLPNVCAKVETWMPVETCSAPTTPSTTSEELDVESPDSPDSQTSTASYSLCPRLPITYNEAALTLLQGRPQVTIYNNLSIPLPSDSECSTDNISGNSSADDYSESDGSPAEEVVADSSCLQIESLTAGTGMDTPTAQAVHKTNFQVSSLPLTLRKMPSTRQSKIPIGIRSFQDHTLLTRQSKSSRTISHIAGPSSPTRGQIGPSVSNQPDRTPSPKQKH